ncbi:MAG TPA: flagellin [Kofleriaceae bacterium]|nr:flagellin [Kofleriaceae bacterium]
MIDLAVQATLNDQSAVASASQAVSSGLRVSEPSDDPSAWIAAQRAKLHQTLSQGITTAMQASQNQLQATDGALSSIGTIVSQVRALAVQGASATYNASQRAELATEVTGLFQSALGAANAQGPSGEYLLAGSDSLTQPFDSTGAYQGDSAARSVSISEATTTQVTVAGSALTAADGVDVLPLLAKVASALSSNDTTALAQTLPDLDTAVTQVAAARGQLGGAMDVLSDATSSNGTLQTDLAQTISNYVEVDTVTAASDLAKASQALQVSQTVSANVIQLLGNQPTTTG